MSRMRSVALALDDRTNPVVVKELRQAVQSRLVSGILVLFLLLNLAMAAGYLVLNSDAATSERAGPALFHWLFRLLVITCTVLVPLYAAGRLTLERNDSNIDLLFVTTISAGRIIRGKFLAALALIVLIYSAFMPFLTFTYLLGGIDLSSIFFFLSCSLLLSLGVTMVAIFFGSVPGGLFLRFLLGAVVLYLMYCVVTTILDWELRATQYGPIVFSDPTLWQRYGMAVLLCLALWGLFYLLAVAAISARSSNRMFPVRVYLTAVWMGFGIFLWAWEGRAIEPLLMWSCVSVAVFSGALVFAPAERESWTPRVRRHIPRASLPRFLAWMLFTGAAGGVLWCLSIIGVSLLVGWFIIAYSPLSGYSHTSYLFGSIPWLYGVFLFAWCYTMTGLLVRRIFFPRTPSLAGPIISFAILLAACTLPPLLGYLLGGERWRFEKVPLVLVLPDPFMVFSQEYARDSTIIYLFLEIWAVLGGVLNLPWFVSQWRAFRRYQRRPEPSPILSAAAPATSAVEHA